MAITAKDLLDAANAAVPRIDAAKAQDLMAAGALLLDVRDSAELGVTGKAEGAHHIPRGILEFRADPATALYDPELRKDRVVILHCASGGRSALAGKLLKDMGYAEVYNLGGFKDWVEGGGKVEEAEGLTRPEVRERGVGLADPCYAPGFCGRSDRYGRVGQCLCRLHPRALSAADGADDLRALCAWTWRQRVSALEPRVPCWRLRRGPGW